MPADAPARDVGRRVVGVATVQCQIDSPDERDPAVYHYRLLVMAVHETSASVGTGLDLGVTSQRVQHLAYVPMRRLEQGNWRPFP